MHVYLCTQKSTEESKSNDDFNTQDNESLLFDERNKSTKIRYAALIAQKNISDQTAKEILNFYQHIGQNPNMLKNMSMSRTKCTNIISNVLYPVKSENVKKLQKTKFSIVVDKTSNICNKNWMTFFVQYVDPETLNIRSQLVKLINSNARDSSAQKLFHVHLNMKC